MEIENLEIVQLLHELGFSSKLKGFGYLKDMISEIVLENMDTFKMKDLYEFISIKYNSTIYSVIKCIRDAINKSWNNANLDVVATIFGYSVGYENDCPSNSSFVNSVIDYIRNI